MLFHVGTSGYSYKEWKGTFYPHDLPASAMLAYYAERFETVEINNTFYRMPRASVLESWKERTPARFRFVLKASQRITHRKDLDEATKAAEYFFGTAASLGEKLGPVLIQFPPWARKDLERLRSILSRVPSGVKAAVEFRHASWADDETLSVLSESDASLCVSDTDEMESPAAIVSSAAWGYLRLRRCDYDQSALAGWRDRIQGQNWTDAWVFFKHEDEGRGPELASAFRATL